MDGAVLDQVRGSVEQAVQTLRQCFAAAIEVCKALAVLRHRERHVKCIGLRVIAPPDTGVEIVAAGAECAVDIAAHKPADLVVKQIDIILRTVAEILLFIGITERLGHLIDAEVVDIALHRPGEAFADVQAGVAVEDGAGQIVAAAVGQVAGDNGGVFDRGPERILHLKVQALLRRVAEDHVGAGADHAVCAARCDPARYPALVLVVLHKAVEHLNVFGGGQQRIRGPSGAVGIPETVVVIHHAVFDFVRSIRAAVLPTAVRAFAGLLGEQVRIHKQAVHAGIEAGHLVRRCAFDFDNPQLVVPGLLGLCKDLVETLVFCDLLLEVLLGLLDADEGGGDFHLHDRLAGSSLFKAGDAALADRTARGKRLAELAIDIHALHAVAVVVGIPGEALPIFAERGRTIGAVAVQQDVAIRGILREGKAHDRRMVRRGNFHGHAAGLLVIRVEGDAVVVRFCDLIFMGKFCAAHAGPNIGNRGRVKAAVRHELVRAALPSPEGGLVADGQMLERIPIAAQLIVVHLIVAGTGDRGPEIKAVRHCGAGADQAAGIPRAVVGAAQGIHIIGKVLVLNLRDLFNADVVDVRCEGVVCAGRVGGLMIADQHLGNGFAERTFARRNIGGNLIPLLGGQGLGEALLHGGDDVPVLIHRVQVAQVGAVAEPKVHRDIGGGILKIVGACGPLGEDRVAELCVLRNRDVQPVIDHVVGIRLSLALVIAADLQGPITRPAFVGSCVVYGSRAAFNRGRHGDLIELVVRLVQGGNVQVCKLDHAAAVFVLCDIDLVIRISRVVLKRKRFALKTAVKLDPALAVQFRPGRAVVGAGERPVHWIAPFRVVRRDDRIRFDRLWLF